MIDQTRPGEDAATLFQTESGPILLDYERAQIQGRDTTNLFNDFGFVVRARADSGEDVYFWTFLYQQRGEEHVIDADLCQTTLMIGQRTARDKQSMHDVPFINKGQNLEDYLAPGALSVIEADGHVAWSCAGRTLIARPPHWELKGEHAGVRCDLKLTQSAPGFHHIGRFEALARDGTAGYNVHGTAEGEIEAGGRTYRIKGYFVHERCFQIGDFPERIHHMGGRGLNWMHAWDDELSWYVMNGDVGQFSVGVINVKGEQFAASGPDAVWAEEIAHWLDPRTQQLCPHKWRVRIRTAGGSLEAVVTAHQRAYYTWLRRGGTIVVHQAMADCEGVFTYPDGRSVTFNQLAMNEHMRTFYLEE